MKSIKSAANFFYGPYREIDIVFQFKPTCYCQRPDRSKVGAATSLWSFFTLIAALLPAMLSPAVEVSVSKGGRRWVNPLTLPSRRKIFMAGGLFSVEHFATSLVVQGLVAFWFFEKFEIQLDSLALIFFASNIGAASSFWVGAKLANRFGLINTMVLTHLPSGLLLIAIPFVPEAWMAIAIWLLFVLAQRMSMPMRLSYTMAIVEPHERLAMATLSRMGHNVSMASGPPIATFLYSFATAAVPLASPACAGGLFPQPPAGSRRLGRSGP